MGLHRKCSRVTICLFPSANCISYHPKAKGPIILKEDTTRQLLSCVLWVLKNAERPLLRLWWAELSAPRLQTMLEILRICISCFQYKVGSDFHD